MVNTLCCEKGQNPELLQMFNEGLKELKRTGEYDKIINKYISTDNTPTKTSKDESTLTGLLQNNYKVLLKGLWQTILLTLISFALALVVGVIFGLFSVAPIRALRTIASIYVDVIRGIPMMVLAFFIFFGLPGIVGFTIPDFIAGIITLTLNASAYIAEIVRGGIKAVPVGQMEASRSLGLSYNRTMQNHLTTSNQDHVAIFREPIRYFIERYNNHLSDRCGRVTANW